MSLTREEARPARVFFRSGPGRWPFFAAALLAVCIHAAFFFGFTVTGPEPAQRAVPEQGVDIDLENLPPPRPEPVPLPQPVAPPVPEPVAPPPVPVPEPAPAPRPEPVSAPRPQPVRENPPVQPRPAPSVSSVAPSPLPVQEAAPAVPSAPSAPVPAAPTTAARVKAVDNPPPVYPELARRRGQQGRVLLRVAVDAAGSPAAVSVQESSGYALLDQAAITAVKGWIFEPARAAGLPVAGEALVPVEFKLR